MPTYYAKLMAEALREMPAAEGEFHPANAVPAAQYAVAVAREAHWSLAETMKLFAEIRELNENAQGLDAVERTILRMEVEP